MSGWGAVASAAGGVLSSVINYKAQMDTNKANANQAAKNRDFQEDMSNTSHQREVEDLRAAGLNPILSANAGASTPGGATATMNAPRVEFDPMMISNLQKARAETEGIKENTENTRVDTGLKAANTRSAEKALEIQEESKKLIQAQTAKEQNNTNIAAQQSRLLDKFGEANQVMGLINSGTGSIGNLLDAGKLFKNILRMGKPKTETHERYNSQGEHIGTTQKRTQHD